MKIPDVNVLLYAQDRNAPRHDVAKTWLEGALSASEPIGFAWLALIGFIRIATNPVVYPHPLTAEQALDVVDGWLAQPYVIVANPTAEHPRILRDLLQPAGTAGNLTNDAHLAAVAIGHGATLTSFDGDFHRFPGLKLEYLR